MRKNGKQVMALVLALGLSAAGSMTGYASGPLDGLTTGNGSISAGGPTDTELLGVINVTQLNVTLPLKAAFDVDPGKIVDTKDADGNVTAAYTTLPVSAGMGSQSADYKIVNNSQSPVWVYITGVQVLTTSQVSGGSVEKAVLTRVADDLTKSKNVMLAIKDKTVYSKDGGTSTLPKISEAGGDGRFLLGTDISSSQPYYLRDIKDATVDSKLKGELGVNETMNLEVFAVTKTGWKSGDKFAIQPTFTVSVSEPSYTPS